MSTLGQNPNLPTGTRDAVHVPFVVATTRDFKTKFQPGNWVKFKDDAFTEFIASSKEDAVGMIDPFLEEVPFYDNVIVLLLPGTTSPVHHHFDINPNGRKIQRELLEVELEYRKQQDPQCADCWVIQNNQITRM